VLSASSGGGSHSFLCKQIQTKPAVPHPTKDNRNVRWSVPEAISVEISLAVFSTD